MLAQRLQDEVGHENEGIGPDINQLIRMFDGMDFQRLRDDLEELERHGLIRIDTGIAGITVLEPLHEHFEELED